MDGFAQKDSTTAEGYTELEASSLAVGLPEGLMGNSEVGHLNIGAGRVVWQDVSWHFYMIVYVIMTESYKGRTH